MRRLEQWLDRLARKERGRVMLEEALLGGRPWRYAAYRLRYMGLARGLAVAIHVVEFAFLTRIFSAHSFGASLMVQNGCAVAAALWWGVLELLRTRLRSQPMDATASHEVSRWLGRAAALGAAALGVAAAASAGRWIALGHGPSLLDVYVLVVVARLAVDMVVRTFYSGVYARRRVYRPVLAILAIEASGLVAILALWRLAGPWSFPIGLALSVAVSRGLLLLYTRRAYAALRMPRPRVRWPRPGRGRERGRDDTRTAVAAGLANAATRVGSVVVLVLLLRDRGQATSMAMALHLVAPLLVTSAAWPHVFYLDFKRLREDAAAGLRRRLERSLRPLATLMGALCWAVAAALLAWRLPGAPRALLWALAPLLLAQSHLARLQLQHFAQERYAPVIGGFVALGAGLVLAVTGLEAVGAAGVSPLVAASAAMVLAAACIHAWRTGRPAPRPWGVKSSLASWARVLARVDDPVRLGRARLRAARADQLERVAAWLAEQLGARGAVTRAGACVYWFERTAGPEDAPLAIDTTGLVIAAAGLIDSLTTMPPERSGPAALAAADQRGLAQVAARRAPAGELMARFARSFPRGLVVDLRPGSAPAAGVARLDPHTRQAIWAQARTEARGGRARPRSGFDVTVYAPAGEIELIFAIPRAAPAQERARWRRGLQEAGGAVSGPPRPDAHDTARARGTSARPRRIAATASSTTHASRARITAPITARR